MFQETADPALTDSALIEKSRRGDGPALGVLLDRHRRHLTAFCCRLVCPPESDAEDAAQEALLRAGAHLPAFRAEAQFSTWLYRIAVNVCHDLLRRRSRRNETADLSSGPPRQEAGCNTAAASLHCPEPGPAERAEARALLDTLRGRLDARSWQVLVFSRDYGLSSPEIARLFGISEGRVRQILGKVRKVSDAVWNEWNPPPS
jgi:RNA polymerase sigma-70 factor (ECF subfamily)